jgi:hypothetical protein
MKKYHIRVERVAGGPLEYLPAASEEFYLEAQDEQSAFKKSMLVQTLKFRGQERVVYVDGKLYRDPRH